MIPRLKTFSTSLALLAFCLASGCAAANFPSGAPPGIPSAMSPDPCRAMDRSLRQASLLDAKETTEGPCKTDVRAAALDHLHLVAQPAALSGLPVSAELYFSCPAPQTLRVYLGPQNWVGLANFEQIQSVKIPCGDKQRVFVALPAWSTDPMESKTAAAKIRPGEPGGNLSGLAVHAWRIYPFGPPPAARALTYVLP